jgi:hypothetical protein
MAVLTRHFNMPECFHVPHLPSDKGAGKLKRPVGTKLDLCIAEARPLRDAPVQRFLDDLSHSGTYG